MQINQKEKRPSDHWTTNLKRTIQECRAETGISFYIFIELLAKKYDIVDDYSLVQALEQEFKLPNLIEDIRRGDSPTTKM